MESSICTLVGTYVRRMLLYTHEVTLVHACGVMNTLELQTDLLLAFAQLAVEAAGLAELRLQVCYPRDMCTFLVVESSTAREVSKPDY